MHRYRQTCARLGEFEDERESRERGDIDDSRARRAVAVRGGEELRVERSTRDRLAHLLLFLHQQAVGEGRWRNDAHQQRGADGTSRGDVPRARKLRFAGTRHMVQAARDGVVPCESGTTLLTLVSHGILHTYRQPRPVNTQTFIKMDILEIFILLLWRMYHTIFSPCNVSTCAQLEHQLKAAPRHI